MNPWLLLLVFFSLSQHYYPATGRGLYRFIRFRDGGCNDCRDNYNFDIGACLDAGMYITYQDHHPGELSCEDTTNPYRARMKEYDSDRLLIESHTDRDCESETPGLITITREDQCLNDGFGYDWTNGFPSCSFQWCSYTTPSGGTNTCGSDSVETCITLAGQHCIVAWVGETYISRSYLRTSDSSTQFFWHFTPDCTSRAGAREYTSSGQCILDGSNAYRMTWLNYPECFDDPDPTFMPSVSPTPHPTGPSRSPISVPSKTPSNSPQTSGPTYAPTTTTPTVDPSQTPSNLPSFQPSQIPTFNPSTTPTKGPTIFKFPTLGPTMTPSTSPSENRVPTLLPTMSSPSVSPTITACAEAGDAEVGSSLLNINEELSEWNSNDSLTIILEAPQKFTVTKIEFVGATNADATYTPDTPTVWTKTTDNCMSTFSGTISWIQMQSGAANLEYDDAATPMFVGYIKTYVQEQVEFGDESVTRSGEYTTPFVLTLEGTATATVAFTWVVDEPNLVDIKDAFSVNTNDPGTGRSQVFVNFTTYTSFPWQGNTSYVLTDETNLVFGGSDALDIHATECFPENKTFCIQNWNFAFEVDGVCSRSGSVALTLPVVWDYLVRYFTVSMTVHLDTACPQFVDSVPLQGQLLTYSDIHMSDPRTSFYLEDQVYLRATLDAFGELSYAEIDNIMIYQYDSDGNLIVERNAATAAAFDVNVITGVNEDTPINVLDISVKLSGDFLEASVEGVDTLIGVEIEVTYARTAARRLLTISKEKIDLSTGFRAFPKPCTNPTKDVGQYVHIPCHDDPTKQLFQICEEHGWKVVKNLCGKKGHLNLALSGKTQQKTTHEQVWVWLASMSSIFLLIAIGVLLIVWCLTKREKRLQLPLLSRKQHVI